MNMNVQEELKQGCPEEGQLPDLDLEWMSVKDS